MLCGLDSTAGFSNGFADFTCSTKSTFFIVTLTRSFKIDLISESWEIKFFISSLVNPRSRLPPMGGNMFWAFFTGLFFFLPLWINCDWTDMDGWWGGTSGCISGIMGLCGCICLPANDLLGLQSQRMEQHILGHGQLGSGGGAGSLRICFSVVVVVVSLWLQSW